MESDLKLQRSFLKTVRRTAFDQCLGARIVMFVQDPTKIDQALKLNDPKIKVGRNYFPISVNMREPYQLEKKFRQAMQTLGGQLDILMLCHGYVKNESKYFLS